MSVITSPGLVFGLNETAYHADPIGGGSLSYSGMKHLLKSPAHYRHYMDAPRVEKKVFDEGHIIHALVLGTPLNVAEIPEELLSADGGIRTQEAKDWVKSARAGGLIPVKSRGIQPLRTIAEAVLANPEARKLFETDLPTELSMFAPDPRTGVNLRGRIDKLANVDGQTVLVDLKTCNDADPIEFRKDIAKFRYYLQDTVYTHLWKWLHPDEPMPEMRFVAVSKSDPHLVSINRTSWDYEDLGILHMERAIDRYKHGIDTGEWPGFGPIVWEQSPPGWMVFEEELDNEMEI